MRLRNDGDRYGHVAIALHWTVVALVVSQFVLANLAEQARDNHSLLGQLAYLARHKSVGITILSLAILRVMWRLFSAPPRLPRAMPPWQRIAAPLTHGAMYALLFALPLTGWAMSSAANFPVSYFGWFTLPDLVAPDQSLKETLAGVHEACATVLFAMVVLHIAAALKHHFVDRDGVLLRMFGVKRSIK